MKKVLFITAILVAITVKLYAQSSVSVFSQDGEKFWVIINGIKQNDVPQTNVKVTGLTEPNYKFKVIFEDASIVSIDKNIYTRDYDGNYFNSTYAVKKDKKGNFVLQLSSYDEAGSTNTQYSTPLTLEERTPVNQNTNQNNNQTVTNQTTTVTTNDNGTGSVGIVVTDPVTGEVINMNMTVNTDVPGTTTTTTYTTTTTTTTNTNTNQNVQTNTNQNNNQNNVPDHYVMPGYNGPIGCPWPMSDIDFRDAKQSISSKTFEDSKLTIAKQITDANCLFVSQVKEILQLFTFEASKLDYAKYAYSHVYDRNNYFKVNDVFTFESTIDELNDFIKTQR